MSSYFDDTASYSTIHFFTSLIFLSVASAVSGLSQKSPASVFLFSVSTNSRLASMSKIPPQSLYALAGFFNLLECYHYAYYLTAKIQFYLRFTNGWFMNPTHLSKRNHENDIFQARQRNRVLNCHMGKVSNHYTVCETL